MSVLFDECLHLNHTLAELEDLDLHIPLHRHRAPEILFSISPDQFAAMDETGEWLDVKVPT